MIHISGTPGPDLEPSSLFVRRSLIHFQAEYFADPPFPLYVLLVLLSPMRLGKSEKPRTTSYSCCMAKASSASRSSLTTWGFGSRAQTTRAAWKTLCMMIQTTARACTCWLAPALLRVFRQLLTAMHMRINYIPIQPTSKTHPWSIYSLKGCRTQYYQPVNISFFNIPLLASSITLIINNIRIERLHSVRIENTHRFRGHSPICDTLLSASGSMQAFRKIYDI